MKHTMQAHLDAIKRGAVTKSNVIGIRKAINSVERIRNGWSRNRSSAELADVFAIEEALNTAPPTVTGELHDSGLKLLRDRRYRKRLANVLPVIEAEHVRFDLVRFDRIGKRGEYAIPVYRCIAFAGAFTFRNIPWQSGGNGPEVLES